MADDDKELKDQRVVTMMSPSELEAIDDWMFRHRIRSRGEAIRRLCQAGIAVERPILDNTILALDVHKRAMNAFDTLRDEIQSADGLPDTARDAGNKALDLTLNAARQLMRQAGIVWMVFTSFTKSGDPNIALRDAMEASADLKDIKLGDLNDPRYAAVLRDVFGVKVTEDE